MVSLDNSLDHSIIPRHNLDFSMRSDDVYSVESCDKIRPVALEEHLQDDKSSIHSKSSSVHSKASSRHSRHSVPQSRNKSSLHSVPASRRNGSITVEPGIERRNTVTDYINDVIGDDTSHIGDIISIPNDVHSISSDVISNDASTTPYDISTIPNDVTSTHNDVINTPNGVNITPSDVNTTPNDVNITPNAANITANDVTSTSNDIISTEIDVDDGTEYYEARDDIVTPPQDDNVFVESGDTNSVDMIISSSTPKSETKIPKEKTIKRPDSTLSNSNTSLPIELKTGTANIALTPGEAKEIMEFINKKISARSDSSDVDKQSMTSISVSLSNMSDGRRMSEKPTVTDEAIVYNVQLEDLNKHSPEGNLSIGGSLNELNLDENKNDPSIDDKHRAAKPKLSLLNKIKRSFKPCSGEKGSHKEINVRQLERPPSIYLPPLSPELDRSSIHGPSGLEGGSIGSLHSISASLRGSRAGTPILDLLARNPEMTSDSISISECVKAPTDGGSIKEVEYTKAGIPGESRSLGSGQSRSKSLQKLYGSLKAFSPFGKRKSLQHSSPDSLTQPCTLTQVTPIPGDASYANDLDLNRPNIDVETQFNVEIEQEIKPRKRKSSFVDKLKRRFSFGKSDKKKDREVLSKSVPALNIADVPATTSKSLPHIHKSASMDDIASIASSQPGSSDIRYQIVLKSAKINKACKCHVCSLVRRNVKQYCSSNDDVTSKKYEVVLKMNMLGADFLNSECGSIISANQSYMIPDTAAEVRSHHSSNSLTLELNGTKSEIENIVRDFKGDTSSVSSKSSSSSSSSSLKSKSGSLGCLDVITGDDISHGMFGSPSPKNEPLSNSRQSAV